MAKILPDFSEAVELVSEPMPAGTYQVRITEVALAKSKTSGTDYMKIKHSVFGAEGDLARFNNWPIFGNYMLSGKGAGMTKALLAALDIDPASFQDTDALLGRELKVTIAYGIDQRNGEKSKYPEIKAIAHI